MHHGSRSPAGALGTSAGAAAEHPLGHLAHRQPLRLADAERIAARPAQARQANATAGVPIATSASQAADWQRSLSTALNWQDVLELPEPLDESARVAAQRPGGDRFNYTTWSAELDGLLKQIGRAHV